MARYLDNKKYCLQHDAEQHQSWSAIRGHVMRITNMRSIRVLYELTVTMATIADSIGLRWRTSSFIICILDNSLVRTSSIDMHEDKRRSAGPAWHGV